MATEVKWTIYEYDDGLGEEVRINHYHSLELAWFVMIRNKKLVAGINRDEFMGDYETNHQRV